MKQKEQKNGMNPAQEQLPEVEMRVNRLGTGDGHCLAHLSVSSGRRLCGAGPSSDGGKERSVSQFSQL